MHLRRRRWYSPLRARLKFMLRTTSREPLVAVDQETEWSDGLPRAEKMFLGRERQLRRLDKLFERPGVFAIQGKPGVGKTTLTLRWANKAAKHFPDGCWYFNLNGTASPGQTEALLTQFLRKLQVPVSGFVEELYQLFRLATRGKSLLIVLDNVVSTEQITELLPAAGNAVVVTSRNALDGLERIKGAQVMRLKPFTLAESREFLVNTVGEARIGSDPSAADVIIKCCEGLPLNLHLAGEQLAGDDDLTIGELADWYTRNKTGNQAVLDRSYQELPADVARVFRLLGSSPLPALPVAAVTAVAGVDLRSAEHMVRTLRRYKLVDIEEGERIRLHSVLRDYAARLSTGTEREEGRRAVTNWFILNVARAGNAIAPGWAGTAMAIREDSAVPCPFPEGYAANALKWLENELDSVLALTRAEDGGSEVWQLPVLCLPYLYLAKPWSVFLECAHLGVKSARDSHRRIGITRSLHVLAWIQHELGHDQEALRHLQEAREVHADIADGRGLAWVNHAQGDVLTSLGRYQEALECLGNALDHFRMSEWPFGIAVVRSSMAVALERLERMAEAFVALEEAREIAERLRNPSLAGLACQRLGTLFERQGRHDEAIASFRTALERRRIARERWGEGETRFSLGKALVTCGRRDEARADLERALAIFDGLDDPLRLDVHAALVDIDLAQSARE